MHLLLSRIARLDARYPRLVITVLVALTLVFGALAGDQSTDTEVVSFAPDSEVAEAFERVEEEFGAGGATLQVVIDAGQDGNVFSPAGLDTAEQVQEAVAAAGDDIAGTGVGAGDLEVHSFADPVEAILAEAGADPGDVSADEIQSVAPAALDMGAAEQVSADVDPSTGTARAGIVAVVFPPQMDYEPVTQASVALADHIEASVDSELEVIPFNDGVMADALQQDSEEEMPRLLGLSLLLILVILLFQYRTISDVLIGMAGLLVAVTWTMGLGVLLGPGYLGVVGPFSQMAMIVPVLIVALGIDYAIHLTTRYREEQSHGLSSANSAGMAVRTVGGALLLATITTMVGFLTNLFSPLPPIADFGIFTAVGVLSAFVVMTTLVPSVRNVLDRRRAIRGRREKPRRPANGLAAVMGRASVVARRAPRVALVSALVLSAAAVLAATGVDSTFGQDDFVPEDSEIARTIDRMEELFAGGLSETTYVVLDGEVTSPEAAQATALVGERLAEVPGVRIADGSGEAIGIEVADGARSGLVAVPTNAGQEGANELADDMAVAIEPFEAAGLSATITSEPLLIEESLDALTASQAQGIAITLAAALALLVTYYGFNERKPLLGAITMVPSLAVVSWVLGTMWLMGISFNVMTAMVASLGIGIGVPFGIHVTHRFLEDRRRYDTIDDAIRHTVTHTGGAMAGSAATTAAGFGVLVLASLVPIQQFGIIVAITIIYSFLAAVLVQPACLKLWGEYRARKGDVAELLEHELRDRPLPEEERTPEPV